MRNSHRKWLLCVVVVLLAAVPAFLFAGAKSEEAPAGEQTTDQAAPEQAPAGTPTGYNEAPELKARVASGELPPVEERLPQEPVIVVPIERIGEYGGTWRRTYRAEGDVDRGRLYWCVFADPLVAWNYTYDQLLPNIAKGWEATPDGKSFTFFLREGMKWSDGEPVTVEDFLFWWNDIALNKELSPRTPSKLTIAGEDGKITRIDDFTFRIDFAASYGMFIEYLANDYFPLMLSPRHYLAQFHTSYGDEAKIEAAMKKGGFDLWMDFFGDKTAIDNPDLPTIQAFMPLNRHDGPLQENVRNPYYWKVDTEGNQLPYIDRVEQLQAPAETGLLKAMAGEIDGQQRGIATLQNYTVIMENREKGDYRVIPGAGEGWSYMGFAGAVYFNLFHKDPVMREIFRDYRFRTAISVGMDRDEINQLIFKGLGVPAQFSAREGTAWYDPKLANWDIEYDVDRANKLLDEVGLKWDANHKWRLRSDGKELKILINTHGPLEPKAHGRETAEILKVQLEKLGLQITVKPWGGELWTPSIESADWEMICHMAQPGNPGWPPILRPEVFFTYINWPTAPEWARWFATDGAEGEEPPEDAKEIMRIREQVMGEPSTSKRIELVKRAFEITAENRWIVGTVRIPMHDSWFVAKNNFRNVPEPPFFMMFLYNFAQCFFDQ